MLLFLSSSAFAQLSYHFQTGFTSTKETYRRSYNLNYDSYPAYNRGVSYEEKYTSTIKGFVGIGINYAFNENYSVDIDLNYIKGFSVNLYSVQPSLVYNITDNLSVSCGANVSKTESFNIENGYYNRVSTPGYGYQLGLKYKFYENFFVIYSYQDLNVIEQYSYADSGFSYSESYKIKSSTHLLGVRYDF